MRMLDADANKPVRVVQLYLSEKEARSLRRMLDKLLADPEASEHEHLFSEDMGAELSFSIVTPTKLAGGYTETERELLGVDVQAPATRSTTRNSLALLAVVLALLGIVAVVFGVLD